MKRFSVRFYGRVQGVGFRYTAYHTAQSLRITGWVRNEPDGTVLCELQGESFEIDEFLGKINNSRYIQIDSMDIKEIPTCEERDFEIIGY